MIKINTSTNTFGMTIALLKQIQYGDLGNLDPLYIAVEGQIFLSYGGRNMQVAGGYTY